MDSDAKQKTINNIKTILNNSCDKIFKKRLVGDILDLNSKINVYFWWNIIPYK